LLPVLKLGIFGLSLLIGGAPKMEIGSLSMKIIIIIIIYGVTDNFARHLGLNVCMIIAKYYLYTTSRKEEEFYFDAFFAILTNKIKIEEQKSKSQINM